MDRYVKETMMSEGTGIYNVQRVDPIKILTSFDEFLESLRNPNLDLEDVEYLRERMVTAEYVGAERDVTERIDAGTLYVEGARIRGRTAEYSFMRDWPLSAGRHLVPLEIRRRAPVAVIGHSVAETLFPDSDPIDRMIKVRGRHLRVVGVVEEQGTIMGNNQDLFAFVPIGMFEKMFGTYSSITIAIKVADLDGIRESMDEAAFHMRIRNRLGPKDRENFAVTSSQSLIEVWESISQGIFMAIGGISAISLVIGGIIIMNIMLVSVTERTREIGIRKAVGARRSGILWQVLVESMTLSVVGGLVGITAGFIAASLVAAFSPLPYSIETWSVVAGIVVTATTGIGFGIYPANRAARLDPIEALRVE
jgi:putative ABC transport system permease protein